MWPALTISGLQIGLRKIFVNHSSRSLFITVRNFFHLVLVFSHWTIITEIEIILSAFVPLALAPLYQEYFWRVWKENPPCPKPSFVSQLITPHVLDVHDLTPTQYFSDATLPPYKRLEGTLCSPLSPCVKSAPYTLWQDLKEVVQSGLLSDMTTSEIRLQEVWKVLLACVKPHYGHFCILDQCLLIKKTCDY